MPVTSFSLAEIELTERRRLEQPLLVLILLGTASFALAEGNAFYLFCGVLAFGVNYMAVRHHMEVYLRRRWVNMAVLVATGLVAAEHIASRQSVPLLTVGHFMVLIQLCKLFERKRSRDYVQLLALNLLLMVTTALLTSAIWFALILFAYIVLLCYVGIVFTLKRGLDRAAETHLPTEPGPLSPREVAWNVSRHWPTGAIRSMLVRVLLPTFLVGLLAFIVIPRTTRPLGASLANAGGPTMGFDPTIRLGGRKAIYLSDRPLGWVRIQTGSSVGQATSQSSLYLRGGSLNDYGDSAWRDSGSRERRYSKGLPTPPSMGPVVLHEFELLKELEPILVAPYPTYRVSPEQDADARTTSDLNYRLTSGIRGSGTISYRTYSWRQPLTDAQRTWIQSLALLPRSHAEPSHIKMAPGDIQRIRDLTRQWAGDLLDRRAADPDGQYDLQIAERIAEHLRSEYDYTLDLSDASGDRDGVIDFLFHLRKGHCEYFASTLAVMCSLEDVSARVATGFYISEYDADEKRYIVRQRDAHAWCEVYTPQTDWTIVDATPAGGREQTQGSSLSAWLSDSMLRLRLAWNRLVVQFDRARQEQILDAIGQAWAGLMTWFAEAFAALRTSFFRLLTQGRVDRLVLDTGMVLILVVIGVFLLHVLRRRRQQAAIQADPARACRLQPLHQLLALLEKRGLRVLPGWTVRETLEAAREQFQLPAGPLESLLALQYRWRWGGRGPTEEEINQAREQLRFAADALEAIPIEQDV